MTPKSRRTRGTGSLFERNGSYYAKWRSEGQQIQRKLGPKRERGETNGLTKTEAEAKLRELMAEVRVGDVQRRAATQRLPHHYTIGELGSVYLEHARAVRGLKATTVSGYEGMLRTHLEPHFRSLPIQRITAERIEQFAHHLWSKPGEGRRGREHLEPKTIANVTGFLAVLLNFAVRKKWLTHSPMSAADLPRPSADNPLDELRFLEPPEVARLIAHAAAGIYKELDQAIYTVAAFSGLRQGELLGLRWRHIDFDRSLIHVLENLTRGRRSTPKGKRRRVVPLAGTGAKALHALRATSNWTAPDDPVFAFPATGTPMSRSPMMRRYRQALEAAELPVDFSFHDLRHTFGTTMARAGVPVGTIQAWMGHADLQTTQLYMHYAPGGADAQRIDQAFGL